MKQLLRDQLENCKSKTEPNAILPWQCMPQVHLWGICPQNKIFTKWCTVESLSANILGFNDQEKSKLTLPSKWGWLCINDTNDTDEKKQLPSERLCIQMVIINKKSFLHPYWEHKLKWDLKENKCCRLGSKMEIHKFKSFILTCLPQDSDHGSPS